MLDCVRFRKQLGLSVVTALLGMMLRNGTVERAALEQRAKELHVHAPLAELLARLDQTPP